MAEPLADARAALRALAQSGIEWHAPERMLQQPDTARRAAVLVLFGVLDSVPATSAAPVARDLDVLLQRRAARMGHHAGQISFPGGGFEASDRSAAETALRETVEETGLDPDGVDVLGALPRLGIPASNNLVTPVLAWWTRTSEVAAVDPREAVEVFRMPVADLLAPENRAVTVITFDGHVYRAPAFQVSGTLVWGFTAMVLDRIFDAVGWTIPWDQSTEVAIP